MAEYQCDGDREGLSGLLESIGSSANCGRFVVDVQLVQQRLQEGILNAWVLTSRIDATRPQ